MAWVDFSKRQQAVVAAAVTVLSCIFLAAAVIGLFVALGRFLDFFADVLAPLAAAAVLATMLKPYYEAVLQRVRKPAIAVVLVLASVVVPFAALFWFFGSLLVGQILGFFHHIPDWIHSAQEWLTAHAPQLNVLWTEHGMNEKVQNLVQEQGGQIARGIAGAGGSMLSAGASVFHALTGLFGWVVMPVYFVFLIQAEPMRREKIEALMPFLKAETRADVIYLGGEFVNIIIAFFRGQLLIALTQGVLYAIGFKLIGIPYGIVIGILMGLLNTIPYLGTLTGLSIVLPTAFFHAGGGSGSAVLAGVVFFVAHAAESYFLTPRIMGNRTGLHPMVIIFALFFWGTALGGILGMVFAIPLTAFLVVFWRLLKSKYIKELV